MGIIIIIVNLEKKNSQRDFSNNNTHSLFKNSEKLQSLKHVNSSQNKN